MSYTNSPRHILVASCLVRNEANQVLLVKHFKRGWELPQGRIENGEALLDALQREVMEETGLTVANPRLATVWSKLSAPTAVIFCFIADYFGGELMASEETPELGWFHEQEASGMISHPVNQDRFAVLLGNAGTIEFNSYQTDPYRRLG